LTGIADVLIRGLSDAAVAHIDAAAAARGLSRQEYLRRRFETERSEGQPQGKLTLDDIALGGRGGGGSRRPRGDGGRVAVTTWLIDKSASTRISSSPDAELWIDRIERGLVRVSTVTRLAIGYSFRAGPQARLEVVSPLSLMPVEYLTPAAEDRAVEVQLLADRSRSAPCTVHP
jgi:hypothetical protein